MTFWVFSFYPRLTPINVMQYRFNSVHFRMTRWAGGPIYVKSGAAPLLRDISGLLSLLELALLDCPSVMHLALPYVWNRRHTPSIREGVRADKGNDGGV
jgi:hypothetical protein